MILMLNCKILLWKCEPLKRLGHVLQDLLIPWDFFKVLTTFCIWKIDSLVFSPSTASLELPSSFQKRAHLTQKKRGTGDWKLCASSLLKYSLITAVRWEIERSSNWGTLSSQGSWQVNQRFCTRRQKCSVNKLAQSLSVRCQIGPIVLF